MILNIWGLLFRTHVLNILLFIFWHFYYIKKSPEGVIIIPEITKIVKLSDTVKLLTNIGSLFSPGKTSLYWRFDQVLEITHNFKNNMNVYFFTQHEKSLKLIRERPIPRFLVFGVCNILGTWFFEKQCLSKILKYIRGMNVLASYLK